MSNYIRFFNTEYNYIFFTIVTFNRNKILISNIDLFKKSLKYVIEKYKFQIVAISVMPDHLHILIKLENTTIYPKIIYSLKNYFSRHFDKSTIPNPVLSDSKIKKGEKGIWQRRYWEHTIKNENDLYKHLDYIHYNPVKHMLAQAPKDWEYSSFKKFVKLGYYEENWYNLNDYNKINNLDFE